MAHLKSRLASLLLLPCLMLLSLTAGAGNIVISGDGNILPGGVATNNGIFFNNILGGGSTVTVQSNTLIPSWSTAISNYYNGQAGISSTVFNGTVTNGVLSGVDLLVSVLPDDNFSVAEGNTISSFLGGGGSLFLIGENGSSLFDTARNAINGLLSQLGSGMSLGNTTIPTFPATIAIDPLTAGLTGFQFSAASGALGGTALISSGQNPFIAYESAGGVPLPAPLALMGLGLLVLGLVRRRAG